MNIIINSSSMIPIYEQIMECIKRLIVSGSLKEGDPLPSVRSLAGDLKISALTVKKAYDHLEAEGYTATIHGKGTYVTRAGRTGTREQILRQVEEDLDKVLVKARSLGLEKEELQTIFELLLEES